MLSNLSFSYDDRILFDRFSPEFKPQQISLVRGDSGRGKTTLLRIMAGLIVADASFNYQFSDTIYFAAESPLISHLSLSKNLALAGSDYYDMCVRLGLAQYLDKKPPTLSFGQRTRANLALAITSSKPILLLDEITQGCDESCVNVILGLLSEAQSAGRTIIVASHDPRMQTVAHRTIDV